MRWLNSTYALRIRLPLLPHLGHRPAPRLRVRASRLVDLTTRSDLHRRQEARFGRPLGASTSARLLLCRGHFNAKRPKATKKTTSGLLHYTRLASAHPPGTRSGHTIPPLARQASLLLTSVPQSHPNRRTSRSLQPLRRLLVARRFVCSPGRRAFSLGPETSLRCSESLRHRPNPSCCGIRPRVLLATTLQRGVGEVVSFPTGACLALPVCASKISEGTSHSRRTAFGSMPVSRNFGATRRRRIVTAPSSIRLRRKHPS